MNIKEDAARATGRRDAGRWGILGVLFIAGAACLFPVLLAGGVIGAGVAFLSGALGWVAAGALLLLAGVIAYWRTRAKRAARGAS